jgi:hypothetical protein
MATGESVQIPNREVPPKMSDALRRWDRIAITLRYTQVALGTTGIVSALIVATFTKELGDYLKVYSFLAALSIGILTAFDIGGKANKTRQAWRHLNTAILRYLYVQASSIDNLIDSYSQAEAMVGDVTFHQPDITKKD